MNEFSPFNLIKLEEFADPNSDAPRFQSPTCASSSAVVGGELSETRRTPSTDFDFDLSDLAWLGEDPLGMWQLRVEGQPWNPPHVTIEERARSTSCPPWVGMIARSPAPSPPTPAIPQESPGGFDPPKNFDLRDEYSYCKADHPGNQGQCGRAGLSNSYMFSTHVRADGRWNDVISQQQFVACEWGAPAAAVSTLAATGQAEAGTR